MHSATDSLPNQFQGRGRERQSIHPPKGGGVWLDCEKRTRPDSEGQEK